MIDCSKTVNFLKENDRMCHSIINGSECGTSCLLSYENNGTYCGCNEFMLHYPEKAIAIVQKWSDENPLRTYLSEFLKNYPNAELDHGVPKVCLKKLGAVSGCAKTKKGDLYISCYSCWNQPVPIEESEVEE